MSAAPRHVPLVRPTPDAQRFVNLLMGHDQGPPPLVEYLVDDVVLRPIVTDLMSRTWVPEGPDRDSQRAYLDNFIAFWRAMGYDFVRFERGMPFKFFQNRAPDTASGANKDRIWADQHQGTITTWEDFERYHWPTLADTDFFAVEYINAHLPEGMGLISCHAGGMFEHLSYIMSYEGLCLALYEQPDLVQALSDKLGELMTGFYRHLLDLDGLIVVFPGDDMGFRTGTLVSPYHLRQYVLPWHKRFAALTHERGLPYFIHSCGKIFAIMDDLMDDVKIDGKHSYEDAILPVQDFQARYGDRIAVLGGLDIRILAGGTPDDVRRHARFLLETCGARGRYALGSGNSIPSYIPVENYLAMVDERAAFAAG